MKFVLFSILFLISLTQIVQAQVTIGSTERPMLGALLDLKEFGNVSNGAADATKGLMLPRVALETPTSLYPIVSAADTLTGAMNAIHAGLLIYNVSKKIEIKEPSVSCAQIDWSGTKIITKILPGVKVWSGDEWENLGGSKAPTLESTQPWMAEGVELVKDIEGNIYTAMNFGVAGIWMTQNLRSKTFDTESGSSMTFPASPSWGTAISPNWSYPGQQGGNGTNASFYNANPSFGLLYNRAAVFGIETVNLTQKVQGICPNGWYIPTFAEAQQLEAAIQSTPNKYTKSETSRNNYDLFTNCNLGGIGSTSSANSKEFYKGGFALYYLTWIHMGQLWDMSGNGAVFWLSNTYQNNGLTQSITNIIDSNTAITESHWSDERSQSIVRCKKR